MMNPKKTTKLFSVTNATSQSINIATALKASRQESGSVALALRMRRNWYDVKFPFQLNSLQFCCLCSEAGGALKRTSPGTKRGEWCHVTWYSFLILFPTFNCTSALGSTLGLARRNRKQWNPLSVCKIPFLSFMNAL